MAKKVGVVILAKHKINVQLLIGKKINEEINYEQSRKITSNESSPSRSKKRNRI